MAKFQEKLLLKGFKIEYLLPEREREIKTKKENQ